MSGFWRQRVDARGSAGIRRRLCPAILIGGLALACVILASASAPKMSSARAFSRALDQARRGHLDAAFLLAREAAKAEPKNQQYLTVREVLRQRATLAHLKRAHQLELARRFAAAATEFRLALAIDPSSQDARLGLAAAFPAAHAAPARDATELRVKNSAPPVEIQPTLAVHDFHLRTGVRQLIGKVVGAYGMRAYIANTVSNRSVRLDLGEADFAQAMTALRAVAGVDWIPLNPHTLYVAETDRIQRITPRASRTFYVPWAANSAELTQLAQLIRTLLGVTAIQPDPAASALSLRASPAQLDAAEKLLLDLSPSAGEVVLQIRILSLNSTVARDLGLTEPNQFTMFALGPLLAQLQQSGSLEQSILQLFQSGGLNAVLNSGMLSPSQLAQAQSIISPLLQNPFVTFGGGATLMALSVPPVSASFNATRGSVASVESALLRATSGQSADLKIGQRYPIINASFSPISLSPAISKEIGSGTFVQPFPSFTYEDLGLDAKITPIVDTGGDIHLQIDISVKALTGVSKNDIPILSDRHVVTALGVRDNEPVMIAGLFTRQEMRTLSGFPGLSQIPVLGKLFSAESNQATGDQLVLLVTPHIVRLPPTQVAATWLPPDFAAAGRLPPMAPPPPGPRLVPSGRGAPNPGFLGPGRPSPPYSGRGVPVPATPGEAPPSPLGSPSPADRGVFR